MRYNWRTLSRKNEVIPPPYDCLTALQSRATKLCCELVIQLSVYLHTSRVGFEMIEILGMGLRLQWRLLLRCLPRWDRTEDLHLALLHPSLALWCQNPHHLRMSRLTRSPCSQTAAVSRRSIKSWYKGYMKLLAPLQMHMHTRDWIPAYPTSSRA